MADTYDDGQGSSFPGPDDFISMGVVRKSGTALTAAVTAFAGLTGVTESTPVGPLAW